MKRLGVAMFGLAALASFPATALRTPGAFSSLQSSQVRRVERTVPFQVGETLTYDVSWSAYLTAGTAITTVKEKRPSYNSAAYYIVAEGRPTAFVAALYPLYYKLDTLIDAYTLLPQRGSNYSEEGGRHRLRTTTFDRAGRKALFEDQADAKARTEFSVSPDVQDVLSALYAVRLVPLKADSRMTIPLTDNGETYTLQIEAGAPERVKTPAGDTRAWRMKLSIYDDRSQPVGRNIAVWLSDDARRLPMKMQADLALGSFALTLRDAK